MNPFILFTLLKIEFDDVCFTVAIHLMNLEIFELEIDKL
jgi:hypothetical protein